MSKSYIKLKSLADTQTGMSGPYGETLVTFGALTAISQIIHPHNVLLTFGILFPSFPFILRAFDTINNKKTKLTFARVGRLTSKCLFVTATFAVSMVVAAPLQSIPFFNIATLSFWDSLVDYLISDGPDS